MLDLTGVLDLRGRGAVTLRLERKLNRLLDLKEIIKNRFLKLRKNICVPELGRLEHSGFLAKIGELKLGYLLVMLWFGLHFAVLWTRGGRTGSRFGH